MNPTRITALVAACLLAAVFTGLWIGRRLPEDQLSPATKETVQLTTGLVATMAALLLGLLVNGAKATYDTTRNRVVQKASKYALLARLLGIYGPAAAAARAQLCALIDAETHRLWPDDARVTTPAKSQNEAGNAFYLAILSLETRDETERTLKAQAVSLAVELGHLLSLMETESTTATSKPTLAVVVVWLVAIFLGYGLIASSTLTATLALIGSALCAASAIFLILELDHPFGGLMRISSQPMQEVQRQVQKPVP